MIKSNVTKLIFGRRTTEQGIIYKIRNTTNKV